MPHKNKILPFPLLILTFPDFCCANLQEMAYLNYELNKAYDYICCCANLQETAYYKFELNKGYRYIYEYNKDC